MWNKIGRTLIGFDSTTVTSNDLDFTADGNTFALTMPNFFSGGQPTKIARVYTYDSSTDNFIRRADIKEIDDPENNKVGQNIRISDDGKKIVTTDGSSKISVYEITEGSEEYSFTQLIDVADYYGINIDKENIKIKNLTLNGIGNSLYTSIEYNTISEPDTKLYSLLLYSIYMENTQFELFNEECQFSEFVAIDSMTYSFNGFIVATSVDNRNDFKVNNPNYYEVIIRNFEIGLSFSSVLFGLQSDTSGFGKVSKLNKEGNKIMVASNFSLEIYQFECTELILSETITVTFNREIKNMDWNGTNWVVSIYDESNNSHYLISDGEEFTLPDDVPDNIVSLKVKISEDGNRIAYAAISSGSEPNTFTEYYGMLEKE